jgi:siroheme synthase-like protein
MKYLPVGLDIRGKTCVVVGGGPIGTRKVENLLRAGGSVVLVSPQATRELMESAASGTILWAREAYRIEHLYGAFLAVAATDQPELNAQVVEDATMAGVLVCDASSASRSEFIFGALHRGERFTVAVFSDGEDPAASRSMRDRIATFLTEDEEPGSPATE